MWSFAAWWPSLLSWFRGRRSTLGDTDVQSPILENTKASNADGTSYHTHHARQERIDVRNTMPNESTDENLAKVVLQDLTTQLVRQTIYPTAYGGWSDIWRCTLQCNSENHEVAVKSFRSPILDDDDMRKKSKRLRRELKIWARLNHANVLPLLGIASGFGPFTALVCPWMVNGTLTSYLERCNEQLSFRQRLTLLENVAAGLHYLHSRSIIHGDLTGSNILVSGSGKPHLADFGFSSIILEFIGTSYCMSSLNGTARWAAPEMFMMPEDQSSTWVPAKSSDVYSFGSIMLQVLSGHVPYADLKRDGQVVLALLRGVRPTRPQTPFVNDRMWDFIQKCWSTEDNGAVRPSAEDVLNFIRGELSGL